MRVFGWILFALGLAIVFSGLAMDATVANDGAAALGSEFTRMYNLGLLQNRELTVQFGLALLISGSVFAAGAHTNDLRPQLLGTERREDQSPSSGSEEVPTNEADDVVAEDLKSLGVEMHGTMYFFHGTGFRTAEEAAEYARANQWMRK